MKDYCKVLGFVLFAEVLTLFIDLTLAFSASAVFRIITCICTIGILAGLMAQTGYSIGSADKKIRKQNPDAVNPAKPWLLGLTAVIPFQICWVLLLLAKLEILDGGFYRFYKLLCAPFLQVCNLICDDVTAHALPVWGLIILLVLSWIPFAAIVISYRMTLMGKRMEDMMYDQTAG